MQNNLALINDEELIFQAQTGKEDAFTELYRRYLPGVFTRVQFKVPETEVEDITQEIFIAVMKSLKNFQGQAKFSTWLWKVTSHKIADFYRSKNFHLSKNSDCEEAADQMALQGDCSGTSAHDDLIAVKNALSKLPENYQEILLLRFVDDVPFNEIAQIKGQSLEATKSLFRRSVAALRKEMDCDDR